MCVFPVLRYLMYVYQDYHESVTLSGSFNGHRVKNTVNCYKSEWEIGKTSYGTTSAKSESVNKFVCQ